MKPIAAHERQTMQTNPLEMKRFQKEERWMHIAYASMAPKTNDDLDPMTKMTETPCEMIGQRRDTSTSRSMTFLKKVHG